MKPQAWSAGSLRQEKKVALLCSLAFASEANYKIRYLLTKMQQLTNLLHPESQFFGDGFLRTLSIGLTIFVCI